MGNIKLQTPLRVSSSDLDGKYAPFDQNPLECECKILKRFPEEGVYWFKGIAVGILTPEKREHTD